jgi:hypothetical protein
MPFQQTVQLAPMNSQYTRRPRFVAILLTQNLDDMRFLKIVQPKWLRSLYAVRDSTWH